MIHRTLPAVQGQSWQEELTQLITKPSDLLERLGLSDALSLQTLKHSQFPLRVTPTYLSLMRYADPSDPLLLQILPHMQELIDSPPGVSPSFQEGSAEPQWQADPLQERNYLKVPGLIHKYQGRVLLVAARQCAINCRYCFRRHFDYKENAPSKAQWQRAFDYIKQDTSIEEVILSGGDPLVLSDRHILWFYKELEKMTHIKQIRIHSRLPIVLPSRLTPQLLNTLCHSRLKSILVIHGNHPNELSPIFAKAIRPFQESPITLLNQSVLLRKVNDNGETLVELSKKLFVCGVLPYYIHLLDKVKGAAHFSVGTPEAMILIEHLRARLPGYLVPRLAKENPGAKSKTIIA